MKLTLELTDDQVAGLRDALRISQMHLRTVCVATPGDDVVLKYAQRIVQARSILGMSMNFRDACDDYIEKVLGFDECCDTKVKSEA